jgi:hypothetical protein
VEQCGTRALGGVDPDRGADVLARLGVTFDDVLAIATEAGWNGADPETLTVSAVGYPFSSPATAALQRLCGADADGRPWSLFCKVIQHPRHWSQLSGLPAEVAERVVTVYPWRQELGLWDEAFNATMPASLRAPRLHRVIDLGDERIALWMEDVPTSDTPWALDRYASAARALGQWNQRARAARLLEATGLAPHFPLKTFITNRLRGRGFAPLADDALWSHAWLAPHRDVRVMLTTLAPRLARLVEALDAMPLCRPHGDACPQNLLIPEHDPNTFVAIDISQQAPTALGCDLAQLAVGLVHAGTRPAADLPNTVDTVLPAYLAGLRDDGWTGHEDDVTRAFWTSLLVRSGFDSIPYPEVAATPTSTPLAVGFAERIALTRFIATHASTALN